MKEQELSSVGHGYALVSLALEAAVKRRKQMLCVGKEYHALVRLLCVGELLYVMDCSYALKVVVMRSRQLCVDCCFRHGGSMR